MGKIILNGTEYGGSGGGGHTIVDPGGTDMPQESKLQFTGAVNVSDDNVNGMTVVDVEGGGNYYLNTIYSTEEKKVGYWTNSKPLYQKTAYISNISISANSSTNVNISDYFSDVDSVVNFECCDENGNAIFPNVMVNNGLSPYSIGVTIDKSADHITFTRGSGSSATISVCLTLWYTKTTDTPELNPQTGGVIYLPTIYSDEERQIGVWRDNKPLYQRTIYIPSLPNATEVSYPHNISNLDKVVEIFGIAYNSSGYSMPIIFANPTYVSQVTAYTSSTDIYIGTGMDRTSFVGYVTLRYTKTTDVAGSGNWNTDGVPTHHYSTNEQVIGTWIDSKPLYQKTISFGALPNSTSKSVAHGISDLDKIVDFSALAKRPEPFNIIPLPSSHYQSTSAQQEISFNATNITIRNGNNASAYTDVYVTLQYTKTTD